MFLSEGLKICSPVAKNGISVQDHFRRGRREWHHPRLEGREHLLQSCQRSSDWEGKAVMFTVTSKAMSSGILRGSIAVLCASFLLLTSLLASCWKTVLFVFDTCAMP